MTPSEQSIDKKEKILQFIKRVKNGEVSQREEMQLFIDRNLETAVRLFELELYERYNKPKSGKKKNQF